MRACVMIRQRSRVRAGRPLPTRGPSTPRRSGLLTGRVFETAMTTAAVRTLWVLLVRLIPAIGSGVLHGQSPVGDDSDRVRIVWPVSGMSFGTGSYIKVKVMPSAGSDTSEVRFFEGTNLIGTVTQSPFNVIWKIRIGQNFAPWEFTAVARDRQGATQTSVPVNITSFNGAPPSPVIQISSPGQGEMFAAPAQFEIRAEQLASVGDAGPVEFFLDGGSLGVVDRSGWFTEASSYYSMSATNLAEGDHTLSVKYLGSNGQYCECSSVPVRVVKLGIHAPRIASSCGALDGRVEFEVVTSFPGKPTIIQVSTNFVDWSAISTNIPPGNTFTFVEASPANLSKRWYRAIVPP